MCLRFSTSPLKIILAFRFLTSLCSNLVFANEKHKILIAAFHTRIVKKRMDISIRKMLRPPEILNSRQMRGQSTNFPFFPNCFFCCLCKLKKLFRGNNISFFIHLFVCFCSFYLEETTNFSFLISI